MILIQRFVAALIMMLAIAPPVLASTFEIIKLPYGSPVDSYKLLSDGMVYWIGLDPSTNATEIFKSDGVDFVQLTHDGTHKNALRVDESGGVVTWSISSNNQTTDIYYYRNGIITHFGLPDRINAIHELAEGGALLWKSYSASSTTQDYMYFDGVNNRYLGAYDSSVSISSYGKGKFKMIAPVTEADGSGGDSELFIFDGVNTRRLTHNAGDESTYPILDNSKGQLLWTTVDYKGDTETINFFDGTNVVELITVPRSWLVLGYLNEKGQVAVRIGSDNYAPQDVFFYDGLEVKRIASQMDIDEFVLGNNGHIAAVIEEEGSDALYEYYDGTHQRHAMDGYSILGIKMLDDGSLYFCSSKKTGGKTLDELWYYKNGEIKYISETPFNVVSFSHFHVRTLQVMADGKLMWYREIRERDFSYDLHHIYYDGQYATELPITSRSKAQTIASGVAVFVGDSNLDDPFNKSVSLYMIKPKP